MCAVEWIEGLNTLTAVDLHYNPELLTFDVQVSVWWRDDGELLFENTTHFNAERVLNGDQLTLGLEST